jgi:hypothetical protein
MGDRFWWAGTVGLVRYITTATTKKSTQQQQKINAQTNKSPKKINKNQQKIKKNHLLEPPKTIDQVRPHRIW